MKIGKETMKNRFIKAMALALCVCMIVPMTFSGCTSKGKTLISLDDYAISANIYQLMLTQQKGKMAYSINAEYGSYNSEKFWGMTIDMATQMTNEDYYNDMVLEKAKNFLCALKLYDELKAEKSDFKMPKSYTDNISAAIDDFITHDAGGSKSKLNSILSDYGINIDMLEEFLLMEAKAAYVVDYLYGSDGSKIGEAVKSEFYKNNYVACKQILIQKYYYLYETDEDGNEMYFDDESGHVIYDKTKTPAINDDGTPKLDKNDNQIYYNNDGSIAYDKVNGTKKVQMDSVSGEAVYKMHTDEKIASLKEKAQNILVQADEKGINGFDLLRRENSDDYDAADATDGMMYYATNVNYASFSSEFLDDIVSSLSSMEIGEVKLLESDLSYNIIIKTELGSGAYNDEKFENYFSDETYGVFDFIFNLKNELYALRLADYIADVRVDEKMLEDSGLTIKTIAPNFYYPDPDIAYHFYDQY